MALDPLDPTVDIDSYEYADYMLRTWLAAEVALSQGKEYTVDGHHVTREEVKDYKDYWTRERRERQGRRTSGIGITIGIPRRSY
jgi:hypothetical protein